MNLILSQSRYLRYFSFTILYVAQGLPFGLVTVALPAFLLERGTSARGRRRVRRRRDAAVDLQMAGGSDDGPLHVSRHGAEATLGAAWRNWVSC